MAIRRITIAGLEDVLQYDDNDFAFAIETTEVISIGGITYGDYGTKNPPIDADLAVFLDSTDSDATVTCTMAQLKAFLKTYFDTIYSPI